MSEASEKIQKRAEELIELFGTATVVTVGGVRLCDFGDLRTVLAERTWRPISEAPTNGTRVLLWHPWYADAQFIAYCGSDEDWYSGTNYHWELKDMTGAMWQALTPPPETTT